MKHKRWISLCLAFVLMFNIMPFYLSTPAEAATLKMTFAEGKESYAHIIWGASVDILVNNTSEYDVLQENGRSKYLLVYDNATRQDVGSKFKAERIDSQSTTNKDYLTLTALSVDSGNPGVVVRRDDMLVDVTSAYLTKGYEAQTVRYEGNITPGESGTARQSGTFEIQEGYYLPVSEMSRAKITYCKNAVGSYYFQLSDKSGIFTSWKEEIPVDSYSGGATANSQVFNLSIYPYSDRENYRLPVQFKPNVTHIKNEGLPSEIQTFEIKEGDQFELTFSPETPQTLNVTVHDQLKSLQEVATSATDPYQKFPSDFVDLSNPIDDFNYLSSPVTLTTLYSKYGTNVKIEWNWQKATDNWGEKVGTPQPIEGLGTKEKRVFTPQRTQQDQYIYLIATATYYTDSFFPVTDLSLVTREVKVKIPGLGTPPVIERDGYKTGNEEGLPPDFTSYQGAEERKFPTIQQEMDVFQGGVKGYTPEGGYKPSVEQYKIIPGSGNGFAQKIVIEADNPEVLSAVIANGSTGKQTAYTFGGEYDNTDSIDQNISLFLSLSAVKAGTTRLTFKFLVDMNGHLIENTDYRKYLDIRVVDTSPDPNALLENMQISRTDTGKAIDNFTFSTDVHEYTIKLPYSISNKVVSSGSQTPKYLLLKPTRLRPARDIMGIEVHRQRPNGGWDDIGALKDELWPEPHYKEWLPRDQWTENPNTRDSGPTYGYSLTSGDKEKGFTKLKFTENDVGRVVRVKILVRAQNPNNLDEYTFNFVLNDPSSDASLNKLELYDEEDTNYITNFLPDNLEYEVTVPYRTKWLKPIYETNFSDVAGIVFNPALAAKEENFGREEWWKFDRRTQGYETDANYEIQITPETERVEEMRTYKIHVIRGEPSRIATLDSLQVTDPKGEAYAFTPTFDPEKGTYALDIPYSPGQVKIVAKTTDQYAAMQLRDGEGKPLGIDLKSEVPSDGILVPEPDPKNPLSSYKLTVLVTAEDEVTTRPYTLEIVRELPNTDGTLSSVVVADQDKAEIAYDFYTNGDLLDYEIEVPYETEKVSFTPTATVDSVQKITIRDESAILPVARPVQNGQTSRLYELTKPEGTSPTTTKFTIEVTPEDPKASAVKYTYTIRRQAPSTDARLIKLEIANAENYRPVFAPDRLSYTATVTEGAEGVNITATANHPKATIKIDGQKVESGVQSGLIRILKEEQTVEIVVTAQDGKTTKTYKVKFTNPNLIQKSSNADLKELEVDYGLMTPKFKAATTDYEVAVKEEVYDVDLIPKTDNKYATLDVYSGTKEIGDEDGNYSAAIQDGENEFTIRVTSQDETKTKEYTVIVYRDEEDKEKTLKPTTVDDVDFDNTGDVIIIDISKYSRIESEVFKEIKDNYPEKTLILEGNDYSLQFEGSELDKIIPSTEIYDFGMTFTSPFEDEIYDLIDGYSGNRKADVVLVHFKNDGALPGPATLTMSLGRHYKNEQLYWHYYNEERDRIDYYGEFKTNSKGTFTVPLSHMSTYIIADIRLYGSDDKSDLLGGLGGGAGGDLGQQAALRKVNPGTGAGGGEA